ncbi:MAG: hypothetical protein K9K39_02250, partial [Desulfohalobiaceae bacterium]|nr:hypothetical protein [Desulfohalobiaceae bacterium]
MGGFPEYPYYDAGGLAGLIRSGEIAASEVRAKAVRRAKAYNAKLNAIVRPMYERVSEAPAEMTQDGPFPGVPFLLKDLQHALGKMRQSNETEVSMSELEIAKGYIPGSIGRIAELHSAYYHNNWGFGL